MNRIAPRVLLAFIALALLPGSVAAQTGMAREEFVFEASAETRTVEVALLWGRIEVVSHPGPEVVFEIREEGPDDGLTSLGVPTGYSVEREADRVALRADSPGEGVFRSLDVRVRVPTDVRLQLRMTRGGDVDVVGVEGSVQVTNLNGSVSLRELVGDADVDARNGSIDASFRRLTPGQALGFATLNGGVTLRVPSDTAADLHLVSASGEVRTDFDVVVDARDSVEPAEADSELEGSDRAAQSIRGRINGGGPLFYLQTWNGPIRILSNTHP